MNISRADAEQHLKEGRGVAFYPEDANSGGGVRTFDPGEQEGPRRRRGVALPAEDEPGKYLLLRDEKGNLTRGGMEHIIRTGGSVSIDGALIESVDDLPTEAELAKGDAQRTAQLRQSYDDRIAMLQAQKSQLEASSEGIQQPPAPQPEDTPERPPRPAPPPAFRPPEGQDKADEGRRERKPRA